MVLFFRQLEKVSFMIQPLKNFFLVLCSGLSVLRFMVGRVTLLTLFIDDNIINIVASKL